jgi:hypothetical protein
VIELSKQVGDLAKLVMVEEGYYFPDRYEIGLVKAHAKAR